MTSPRSGRRHKAWGVSSRIEGMRHRELPIFSVQYHPEAAPGPHDASYLFSQFAELIERQ